MTAPIEDQDEIASLRDQIADLRTKESVRNKELLARHHANRADLLVARTAKIAQWKAEDNATANARIAEMQRFAQGLSDIDKVITDAGGTPPTETDEPPVVPNAPKEPPVATS